LKHKILITEALPSIEEEKKILEKYAEVKIATSTSEENLIKEAADVDVIMVVYAKITGKVIDSAKNSRESLDMISVLTT
jgi:phosphoglycerate dehydrogenase-like enzyme